MNNKIEGQIGENLACGYLKKQGYKSLKQNYTNKIGEIDIIATKDGCIIFVEVKNRSSAKFGLPREAVTVYKQNKIRRVALGYLKETRNLETEIRFDVIEVLAGELTHIKNAF